MKHRLEQLKYVDYPIIMLMADAESTIIECGTEKNFHPILPRATVNILFSGIEGSVFVLKQIFHDIPELNHSLQPKDMMLLQEKTPALNSKGESIVKDARISLDINIRFLERISNQVLGTDLDIVNSEKWEEFKQALKVRHRITHPKSMDDIVVSEDELKLMTRVFYMFVDFFGVVIEALKNLEQNKV